MIVAGADPGLSGAVVVYDSDTNTIVGLMDVPTNTAVIGGKKRQRLDENALLNDARRLMVRTGCKVAIVEDVQGYGKQAAGAAFQFGFVAGQINMALRAAGIIRLERRTPAAWKLRMEVPLDAPAIVALAKRHFPGCDAMWHGPRGGLMHDRAEAALLAKYGATVVFR
jgi:hypothetical protein